MCAASAADHDLTRANEDYLEAIYRLSREDETGEGIRSVDVAEQLEVSKVSVNHAIHASKTRAM